MKKATAAVCVLILSLAILAGCMSSMGYKSDDSVAYEYASSTGGYGTAPAAAPVEPARQEMGKDSLEGASGLDVSGINNNIQPDEKMIYTAWVEIETLDFDGTLETLNEMIAANGAFLQSSKVAGNTYYQSYYSDTTSRYASFIIRVPADRYGAMIGGMKALGYVKQSSEDAQNITAQYTDVESRLEAYKTEEARLLELLKKADTVEDIITIETRLSQIRYEKESLTSTLRYYDNQVDYSTINLNIQEVAEIRETPSIQRTYGERIADAFKDSVKWVIDAGKNIGVFIVSAIPVIIIPAVIVAVVFIVLNIQAKKRRKLAEKSAENKTEACGQDKKDNT